MHLPTRPLLVHHSARGDTVADGKLAHVPILQISHTLIPVIGFQATQVGPGDERLFAAYLQGRLEGEGGVTLLVGRGFAAINQKERQRPRSCGHQAIEGGEVADRADGEGQFQAGAVGNVVLLRLLGSGQPQGDFLDPLRALPAARHAGGVGSLVAVTVGLLQWPVVTPADGDTQLLGLFRDQHTQAYRRREQGPASGGRFGRQSVVGAARVVQLVYFLGGRLVYLLLLAGIDGHEEAGQIPA